MIGPSYVIRLKSLSRSQASFSLQRYVGGRRSLGGLSVFALFTLCMLLFWLYEKSEDTIIEIEPEAYGPWKLADLLAEELPKTLLERDPCKVQTRTIIARKRTIFVRECLPSRNVPETGKTILLLHGSAYTSEVWEKKVATLQTMSALGHWALAVDLVGYGHSPHGHVGDRGEFTKLLLEALFKEGDRPILVSPSMSGTYSIGFIMKHSDMICAFVAVSPTSTEFYPDADYRSLGASFVPTLVVRGENENESGVAPHSLEASRRLSLIPTSTKVQVIPGAGHPAYVDDPDRWNKLLHNFVSRVPVCEKRFAGE